MAYRRFRLPNEVKQTARAGAKRVWLVPANAFILEAVEERLQRKDAAESVVELEARIAADFNRMCWNYARCKRRGKPAAQAHLLLTGCKPEGLRLPDE